MENNLRHALNAGEFLLHYQPQVDVITGEVVGAEALLQWQPAGKSMLSPAEFIPMAEETGLIVPIGEWVIRRACEQQQAWAKAGMKRLQIAVNISAKQFAQEDLAQKIAVILEETGASASDLELEITESTVMSNLSHVVEQLQRLKNLGVHLAIDDFGTGHSSLAYLIRFPIDILKIDRSFINDVHSNEDTAAIVKAIATLAHSLKLKVVDEGVEFPEQLELLREVHCHRMQGYLGSKPLAPEAFKAAIDNGLALHDKAECLNPV